MEERKIIKFGNSSFIVTLPFEWIKKNKLTKGDKLNLIENSNSIILSLDEKTEDKSCEIDIDKLPMKSFNRQLISYYLKNYKNIKIVGENVIDKLEDIKVLKQKLSSVEITEVNKNYVMLKDLTNSAELNVNSLISEIIEMEKILFEELTKKTENNKYHLLSSLDSNINKLAFLAFKGLNFNLEGFGDREQIRDTIYFWRMVHAFEKVGDILKRIARYLKDSNEQMNIHLFKTLENLADYFNFVTGLLEKNIKLENNLKLYQDKKQSLLREFELLRDHMQDDINLYLVFF